MSHTDSSLRNAVVAESVAVIDGGGDAVVECGHVKRFELCFRISNHPKVGGRAS